MPKMAIGVLVSTIRAFPRSSVLPRLMTPPSTSRVRLVNPNAGLYWVLIDASQRVVCPTMLPARFSSVSPSRFFRFAASRAPRSLSTLSINTLSSPLTFNGMAPGMDLYIGFGRSTTLLVALSSDLTVGTPIIPTSAVSGSTPIDSSSLLICAAAIPGRIVVQNSGFGWLKAWPYSASATRFFSALVMAASRCIRTCARMFVTALVLPVRLLVSAPLTVKPPPVGCVGMPSSASSRNSGT